MSSDRRFILCLGFVNCACRFLLLHGVLIFVLFYFVHTGSPLTPSPPKEKKGGGAISSFSLVSPFSALVCVCVCVCMSVCVHACMHVWCMYVRTQGKIVSNVNSHNQFHINSFGILPADNDYGQRTDRVKGG